MDNCLSSLLFAVEKQLSNEEDFKIGFKTWIKSNKMKFLEGVIKVFDENAKSSP